MLIFGGAAVGSAAAGREPPLRIVSLTFRWRTDYLIVFAAGWSKAWDFTKTVSCRP
jgi:hypothetical protein